MADAVFKGYGGAGYTHSGGGGLLQPNDFNGMAALLVESADSNSTSHHSRRREALRRLMDPIHGNPLVRRTLTCLERECGGTQPTIPEACNVSSTDDDSEDEERSTLMRHQQFVGAAVSMLPPGEASTAVTSTTPTIGSKVARRSGSKKCQRAEGKNSKNNPDVATFTTLFPNGDGGFADTKDGCSRRHYIQKMLGSVATPFRRAEEVNDPQK